MKKLFIISFLLFSLWFSFTTFSNAQLTKEPYDPKDKLSKELDDIVESVDSKTPNLGKHVNSTNTKFLADLFCRTLDCVKDKTQLGTETSQVYGSSAVGSLSSAISFMYEQPAANTTTYIADVLDSANFVTPPAYAQGLGFASLNPILNAWKTFRNIAYFFFIIIFLVIGFMIMLRQKIGSQTVVTAQQAIPHVIVALLFVTFSYAIAGLLIDGMYLIMFLIIGIFGKDNSLINQDFLGLAGLLLTGGLFTSAYDSVATFIQQGLGGENFVAANVLGIAGGLITGVVIAVAVLIGVFRLFFELLKTYISILISITTAPLILMVGALPGQNTFGKWLKSLVGNLIAFPTVVLVLILFDEMTGGIYQSADGVSDVIQRGGFLPPYLAGSSTAGTIPFLIGLGIILLLPDLVVQAKKAFGATGGPFEQLSQALGDAVKRGWTGDSEIIPGLGLKFSNLGISGKGISRNAATVGGTALGGAFGGLRAGDAYLRRGTNAEQAGNEFMRSTRLGGRIVSDLTGGKYFAKDRKARNEIPVTQWNKKVMALQDKEIKK